MPTKVDVATKAAHEEISNAVEQIENNLPASLRSSSSRLGGSSPLFRDEVQQHEMRYLDRLLAPERPAAATDSVRRSQTKETALGGGNQRKESLGLASPRPRVRPGSHLSKIASVLCPYDYKDDDEQNKGTNSAPKASTHPHTQDGSHEIHNRYPIPVRNNARSTPAPNQRNRTSVHRPHNETRKSKPARTAVPPRNKRRPMHHKWIRRAQLSSRTVVARVARLGKRCTRNMAGVEYAIRHGVARAIATAHSMLGEAPAPNSTSGAEQGPAKVHAHGNARSVENTRAAHSAPAAGGATATLQQEPSSVRIPPNDPFALMTSWMQSKTSRMSSQAISMAKRRIRN